ncbi:MAG: hypothetical protein SFZ24_08175 [Planctomycetota bacterium]|nr:hypothetical protein [Planctomycetota bacterium]
MVRVARYSSDVIAEAAAAFLRANGISARVVGQMLPETVVRLTGGGLSTRALDVMIASRDLKEQALALLQQFDETPVELDVNWEEHTKPDLSRLPEGVEVACPRCGESLAVCPPAETCPGCGGAVDVVELLIATHGPDVLAACFDSEEGDGNAAGPGALSASAVRRCRACRGVFESESARGRCPLCGSLYDAGVPGGGA